MESPRSKTSTSTATQRWDNYNNEAKYTTTLPKKGVPFKRRSDDVPGLNYSTATKNDKKIAKR